MSLITFSAFRTAINTLVFPEGQAEVRVPLFRNFITNALIQLQTFVESYQSVNVNFYDKDQSWDDCGLSIVQACRGRIGAVYAFKPSCRCTRYFYDSASLEKMSCFYEHCRCHQAGTCCCGQSMFSAPSLYTANPYYCGDYVGGNTGCQPPYLAAQPEDDCAFKLSDKFFAIGPNQKLWLFPRFPCGYILAVHWRGIRRSYLNNDYVPDDDDLKDAVALYVESEIARRVDKDQATADKLYADYRMRAGDIIFREEQDLKPRVTRVCVDGLDMSELVQIYPDNPYPTNIGQTCATTALPPDAPVVEIATPELIAVRINEPIPGHNPAPPTILEWTQAIDPEQNEIWISVNGGAFTLFDIIDGTLTIDNDATPMASDDVFCYEVRGVKSGMQGAFSNVGCAVKDKVYLGTSPSEPTWMLAYGDFAPNDPLVLVSVSFPALKRITGILSLDQGAMTSVNFDALEIVDVEIHFDSSSLTSLSLPSLTTIGGGTPRLVAYNGITPEMLLPALFCDNSIALVTVSMPNLIFENGKIYTFDSCALNAATIEHILARIVASGCTHCFVTLDGQSPPVVLSSLTAQGQADYNTAKVVRGNSISIDP